MKLQKMKKLHELNANELKQLKAYLVVLLESRKELDFQEIEHFFHFHGIDFSGTLTMVPMVGNISKTKGKVLAAAAALKDKNIFMVKQWDKYAVSFLIDILLDNKNIAVKEVPLERYMRQGYSIYPDIAKLGETYSKPHWLPCVVYWDNEDD